VSTADRERVVAIAESWTRTPYHNNAQVKGVGVDCAQLPAAVFAEAGVIPPIHPDYPPDWHLHRSGELYCQWIEDLGAVECSLEDAGPADLILWRFGRTFSHGAIFLQPPTIIHAYREHGMVCIEDWTAVEELKMRPHRVYTFWPKDGHGR
jgi:cell wall-associated NlpC family hydrolase